MGRQSNKVKKRTTKKRDFSQFSVERFNSETEDNYIDSDIIMAKHIKY